MNGRLGKYHHHTQDESADHQNGGRQIGKLGAKLVADGHEAYRYCCQKDHQTNEGIPNTNRDLSQFLFGELENEDLQNGKEGHDQSQSDAHLFDGMQDLFEKSPAKTTFDGVVRYLVGNISADGDTQKHNGQNGANRAHGDQTEGIFADVLSANGSGNTNTQRHNEGHGDRACRYTARIKGHGQKSAVPYRDYNSSQSEQGHVEVEQHGGQGLVAYHFHHGKQQEQANAHADSHDEQRTVEHVADLIGQNRQIGLCHGNEQAHEEAYTQQEEHFFGFGQACTGVLTHGGHSHICAHAEQPNAQNEEYGRDQENADLQSRKMYQRSQIEQADDGGYGKHGEKGFLNFL